MAGLQKILLVEDNGKLRELYSTFLKQSGFQVAVAKDGESALAVAQNFEPELVFLDVMLSNENGFDILKKLRHSPEYKSTHSRIVLLTNLNVTQNMDKQALDDIDGYAIKADITMATFLDIIRSFDTNSSSSETSLQNTN